VLSVLSKFHIDTLAANDADTEQRSAQETVHTEPKAAGAAQETVHTEAVCSQPASSAEVAVDSDSVYSICCSDVTNDADTPDIVHIDYETPVITGHGTRNHSIVALISFFLHYCIG